jgi:hypothetical protein
LARICTSPPSGATAVDGDIRAQAVIAVSKHNHVTPRNPMKQSFNTIFNLNFLFT